MKTFFFGIYFFFITLTTGLSQTIYTPNWESLDKRPIPTWFQNAKFGIFIHWGLYSVPAWSPKGTYAEWYQYWLDNKTLFGNGDFKGDEIYNYHQKIYGKDFTYMDFAPLFKAQDYNATEWADLFVKSGARYAVLTTKHHDGFALWDSKEASFHHRRPWNSMEIGAHRNLVEEFVKAIRKTPLKAGCYFSLREWNNPFYTTSTMPIYVEQHLYPQLKDLITKYKPDLIWADGPDNYDEETWKTKEFFAWLYSSSEVKDSVVINDRWAKFKNGKHGDFYTSEYSSSNKKYDKPWEECRGMGFSFGYNKLEDIEDYAVPQALIHTLIKIVSQGGNLLLNIGPTAEGKIPPIMQERLLQIGEWLKVNGEGIYNTRPWKKNCQWSEGKRDWKSGEKYYVSGNAILKQTVNPEPGYATQEVFFTCKANNLYAILTNYPDKITLKDVKSTSHTIINLLGYPDKLRWEQKGQNLIVYLPQITFLKMPCKYAWTLKITNIQ